MRWTGKPVCAVVKADAYGHGAFDVSVCLEKSGVKAFAVATADEGLDIGEAMDRVAEANDEPAEVVVDEPATEEVVMDITPEQLNLF